MRKEKYRNEKKDNFLKNKFLDELLKCLIMDFVSIVAKRPICWLCKVTRHLKQKTK